MPIKVGDTLPDVKLKEMGEGGPKDVSLAELTKGKKVVIFAVPGAFTPTCSMKHLPGFVESADSIRKKGVDDIVCLSVNDAFVMGAWGREQKSTGIVRMMADGSAEFTKAAGLTLDLTSRGMGVRSQRYSMLVVDGVVKQLNVEAGGFDVSSAEKMLAQLG